MSKIATSSAVAGAGFALFQAAKSFSYLNKNLGEPLALYLTTAHSHPLRDIVCEIMVKTASQYPLYIHVNSQLKVMDCLNLTI